MTSSKVGGTAGIVIGLYAYHATAIIGVAATRVITASGLVVVVIATANSTIDGVVVKRLGTFFFLNWSGSLVFALQPIFVLSIYINVVLRNSEYFSN